MLLQAQHRLILPKPFSVNLNLLFVVQQELMASMLVGCGSSLPVPIPCEALPCWRQIPNGRQHCCCHDDVTNVIRLIEEAGQMLRSSGRTRHGNIIPWLVSGGHRQSYNAQFSRSSVTWHWLTDWRQCLSHESKLVFLFLLLLPCYIEESRDFFGDAVSWINILQSMMIPLSSNSIAISCPMK